MSTCLSCGEPAAADLACDTCRPMMEADATRADHPIDRDDYPGWVPCSCGCPGFEPVREETT